MQERSITITLKKEQIVNDVVVQSNILGRALRESAKDGNSKSELPSLLMTPDDGATKPIVARALTAGFAAVKNVCGVYLNTGRTTDDNRLEKIATSSGNTTTYSEIKLSLSMPVNFNTGVTESIKAAAHKAIVDFIMKELLFNQLADKSTEYEKAFQADLDELRTALRARISDMSRRATDWT
jgi:hypothetical protein